MFARLTLFLFCAFLLVGGREPPWADANVAWKTAQAMVERHELSIDLAAPSYFFVERNGKKYGYGSLGTALSQVPAVLLQRRLSKLPGIAQGPLLALCSHLVPALCMALAVALFARRSVRMGATLRLGFSWSLVLAFATVCLVYARSSYGEALQTLLLVWMADLLLSACEAPRAGPCALLGLCFGMLFVAKPLYAAILPSAVGVFVWARWRDGLLRVAWRLALAGLCALPGLWVFVQHNAVKTGHFLQTGYQSGQLGLFEGELPAGLFGLLLSPGKGLLFFAPPVVLSLWGLRQAWQTHQAVVMVVVSFFLPVLFVSAKYPVWHGGYCFGPRYLVPTVPLLLWLALPLLVRWWEERKTTARIALVSCALVGGTSAVLGSAVYWDHYCRVLAQVKTHALHPSWSEDHHPFGYFVPQFSPLVGHAWVLKHTLQKDPNVERDAPWQKLLRIKLPLGDEFARWRLDVWALDWLWGNKRHTRYGFALLLLLFSGMAGAVLSARGKPS